MIGKRKLILSLSVLAVGGALAFMQRLTPDFTALAMWVLGFGVAGNVGEHFSKRGQS